MNPIRFFISSPGDVAEERDRAKQVVERLRHRYAGKCLLKPLLWEELPLGPDMSFPKGIDMVLSQDRGLEIAFSSSGRGWAYCWAEPPPGPMAANTAAAPSESSIS